METLVIICFSILFGLLGLLAFLLLRVRNSPDIDQQTEDESNNELNNQQSNRPVNDNELRIGNKIIKSRKTTLSKKSIKNDNDENDLQDNDSNEPTTSNHGLEINSTGKIGKKKLQKLEMKAEKKAAREQEIQLREERKLQKEKEDEIQRKIDEERDEEERKKEEEEKRLIAEQKQKEYEQYLKAKKSFIVEEEGFDSQIDNDQQNKLIDFINYIKDKKIVMLEELAGEFKMKTQEVINRINELLNTEQLEGVIDDRGKFIHITQDEFNSVAKFIKQNGRVSITDLVENSNRLIRLEQANKK